MIKMLLRLEGVCFFLMAIFAYSISNESWWMFLLLFFVPDLSLLGYLANPKLGAQIYNAVHTYVAAGVLVLLGWLTGSPLPVVLSIILVAHIGLDRALGLGLKYPEGFKKTHLQKV